MQTMPDFSFALSDISPCTREGVWAFNKQKQLAQTTSAFGFTAVKPTRIECLAWPVMPEPLEQAVRSLFSSLPAESRLTLEEIQLQLERRNVHCLQSGRGLSVWFKAIIVEAGREFDGIAAVSLKLRDIQEIQGVLPAIAFSSRAFA